MMNEVSDEVRRLWPPSAYRVALIADRVLAGMIVLGLARLLGWL